MPVEIGFEKVGTFKKHRDRTAEVGLRPNLLNEDRRLYGKLKEECQLDLKIGSEEFKDEGYGDVFQSLFDYVKKTSKQGTPLTEVIGADFVSNRRNLITLSQSVYSKRSFVIRAVRKNGVIFLCDRTAEFHDPDEKYDGYGYKFELYMTLDDNGKPHDVNERPSNAECFKSVLRTSLRSGNEEIKVFYAAEMDARDRSGRLVEFKSTCSGYPKWLKNLSLYHYLQSFFGDVPLIVKGLKTYEYVVYKVDKVIVSDIPKMEVMWKPQECFEKLFEILKEVKSQLPSDDEALIIRGDGQNIYYEPEDPNKCTFVDSDFLRYFE